MLDLGCGWGELLLRILDAVLDAVPGAVGTGIDLSSADLGRGRDNAVKRGLASRVSFVEESAVGTAREPADLEASTSAPPPPTHHPPPRAILWRAPFYQF